MHKPDQIIEIFLQPGEIYFGDRMTRIRTVLGSCVSLVFWHPHLLVGGMCHFMLPKRSRDKASRLDGRYADEAIELALMEIHGCNTHPRDYKVKMFGGGNMFPGIARVESGHVGSKNVMAARELVRRHNFDCVLEHVEGSGHRNLFFDVWSGVVSVRHRSLMPFQQGDGVATVADSPTRSDKEASLLLPLQFSQGTLPSSVKRIAPTPMPKTGVERMPLVECGHFGANGMAKVSGTGK